MPVFPDSAEPGPTIAVEVAATTSTGAFENENASASDFGDEFGTGHGGLRPIPIDGAHHFHDHAARPEFNDDQHFAVDANTGAEFDRHRHIFQQGRRLHDPEHKLDDVLFVADPINCHRFVAGSDRAFVRLDDDQVRRHGSAAEHADQYGAVFRHARQCCGQYQ